MSEYIKFLCERVRAGITPFDGLAELNAYRRKLLDLHLIGLDRNGIGFGNLSVRDGTTHRFYVTGSATGGVLELTLADCAKVVAYDFERNWVQYEGCVVPSSESLTHAAIYQSDPAAGAIVHCHDSRLWQALLNHAPTSLKSAEYGTPEMANQITHLCKSADARRRKIIIMAGHEGGILSFGKNLDEAFTVLIRERQKISL